MTSYDPTFWEQHWTGDSAGPRAMSVSPANPHLVAEIDGLAPGRALEAGCGAGAEAIWLADAGWQVTAVDVSSTALAAARERAGDRTIEWIEADLTVWEPAESFDLVTSHYAHSSVSQLDLYVRIGSWVAPGGTLLLVGHLATHDPGGHEHPADASVTAQQVADRLACGPWRVDVAREAERTFHGGRTIHDVVVRATRAD